MKKKLKLAAILIGLALIFAGGISIYLKITSVNTMLNKKQIKIEDETGSYEIVYAKDLKRIKMTNKKNVLVSGDNNSFYYEFTEADRKVKKLKVGQTFYGVLPGNSGEVIAAVVEDIQVNEDRVIIRGSQPAMGDLFDKVVIDATYTADALVIDELAEGVVLEETSLNADTVSENEPDADWTEQLAGIKLPFQTNRTPKRVPINHTFKQSIKIKEGAIAFTGSLATTIETVTVSVDFAGGENPVYTTAEVKTISEIKGELMAEGVWVCDQLMAKFHVETPIPLLSVPVSLGLYGSISGSIGGSFSYRQTSVNGANLTASTGGVDASEINRVIEKKVDADFVKIKANMKVGPKVAVGLDYCFGMLNAEISALVGVSIDADYAPSEQWDEFADSCHDCGLCIDGKISAFAELAYKATLKLLKLDKLSVTGVLGNWSVPIEDFYLSSGPDGKWEPRFEWGECPYRRYRTEIKVFNERGEISGAEVRAIYPDGRIETCWTDEFGYAIIWLPEGDNTLLAEYNGYVNSHNYTVNSAPGKTEIDLEFDQQIYILCDFYEYHPHQEGNVITSKAVKRHPEDFSKIWGTLKAQYPNAEFYSTVSVDWSLYDAGGIRKYFDELEIEPKAGDIILYINAGYAVDRNVLAGVDSTADYYRGIDGELYLCLNNGLLEVYNGTYSLDWEIDGSEGIPDPDHPGWDMGFNRYLTEVYFSSWENVRDFVEYDEQFNHISSGYWYEGHYCGQKLHKEERTLIDVVYYITGTEFDHNSTGYMESQVSSWGEALIDFGLSCITERIDPLLVE